MSAPLLFGTPNTYTSPATQQLIPWNVGDIVTRRYGNISKPYFRVEKVDNDGTTWTHYIRKVCDGLGWSPKKPKQVVITMLKSGNHWDSYKFKRFEVVNKQSVLDKIQSQKDDIQRFESKLQVLFP